MPSEGPSPEREARKVYEQLRSEWEDDPSYVREKAPVISLAFDALDEALAAVRPEPTQQIAARVGPSATGATFVGAAAGGSDEQPKAEPRSRLRMLASTTGVCPICSERVPRGPDERPREAARAEAERLRAGLITTRADLLGVLNAGFDSTRREVAQRALQRIDAALAAVVPAPPEDADV
jgi:hypothetical protein